MQTRRSFLAAGAGAAVLAACARAGDSDPGDVGAVEDLMREHGVLRRLLLVLETCTARMQTAAPPRAELASAAGIIRRFVEDYHEKLEEDYLFPIFRMHASHAALVDTLYAQHRAGRALTDRMLRGDPADVPDAIAAFTRMYRPHAAREDTVLFPSLHHIVRGRAYDELGDRFEDEEHRRFGARGFAGVVDEVAGIERSLGIEDLARFTPALATS
ncbi:MAG TPA: hemerythrin domain-containing protein [Kofleriaceae bacterium]|nr:hemerythrin domain-containing protein [Kofleriaceae bacterium]